MQITFFGLQGSFDYWQIGGTDSYFRRIAFELSAVGAIAAFVHYGCDIDSTEYPEPGITIFRYVKLIDAIKQYFVRPEEKSFGKEIVVTYMGRTVTGKGAVKAVEIFKQLGQMAGIKTEVYGYVWPDNREDHSVHNRLNSG